MDRAVFTRVLGVPGHVLGSVANSKEGEGEGFTLIEILVVILIIGILAAYFGQNIFGQTNDAKLSVSEIMLTQKIPEILVSFYSTHSKDQVPSREYMTSHGLPASPPWHGGARWYFGTRTKGSDFLELAWSTTGRDDPEQGLKNANAIMRQIIVPDHFNPDLTHTAYRTDQYVRKGLPLIIGAAVGDLQLDQVAAPGIAVRYRIPVNP